jgi:hypothetical protein
MYMKRASKIVVVSAVLFLTGLAVSAQSTVKIESELMVHMRTIKKYSAYGSIRDYDRLEKENAAFRKKLLAYAKLPATLVYGFPKLSKEIFISTSSDGRFRIYSWDTEEGGTMHSFDSVYQYKGSTGRVFSKSFLADETDAGAFVSDIFTLKSASGPVYLARFSSILSTSLSFQSIDLFKIRGNVLDSRVKLIKTKKGLTHTLGFQYNFFSVVDRKERPIKLITYDEANRTIMLPVVIADDKDPAGRVTDRVIKYRFNGTYFVKVR